VSFSDPLPARHARRLVSNVPLNVEALPGGKYRVSSPAARGWAGVAGTPHELARVLAQAFHEVTRASVARANRDRYDLDGLTMKVAGDPLAGKPQARIRAAPGAATRSIRHRAHAPESWTRMEDGRWRSPGGRMYSHDSAAVRSVRKRLGEDPS